MSSDEFWKQDPELFWAYRFSYYEKQREYSKKINYEAWLHGLYVREAVSVSLSNSFSRTQKEYRSSPIELEPANNEVSKQNNKIETMLKNRVSKVQELFRSGKCKTN